MKDDNIRAPWEKLYGPFKEWPTLRCTACGLGPLEASIERFESRDSVDARQGDGTWDGWQYGFFHGILQCSRSPCAKTHAIIGEWSDRDSDIVETASEAIEEFQSAGMSVRHILPPLPLLALPKGAPPDLADSLLLVSGVLLSDTNAAANRMRAVVEQLLDYLKIRKFPPGRRAARDRLNTHARIVAFQSLNAEAAEYLMAIKWIGNAGSHEGKAVSFATCLDGLEFLDVAIRLIFDQQDAGLKRRAAKVIKKKGPIA
ncbi:DUF4145 domain-containing protein [Pseudonocardia adelaidensis]|uniref:DUF4145 domain-containing protein n=1 Tax=Pseudonocardia adelaidensis TaxID=648754 RepID=A0ABP9NW16_9PSEU